MPQFMTLPDEFGITNFILRYVTARQCSIVREVLIDEGTCVRVVGEPHNGAYEWAVCTREWIKHSDAGYGSAAIALRDGLMIYFEYELSSPEVSCREAIRTIHYQSLVEGGKKYWRYAR